MNYLIQNVSGAEVEKARRLPAKPQKRNHAHSLKGNLYHAMLFLKTV